MGRRSCPRNQAEAQEPLGQPGLLSEVPPPPGSLPAPPHPPAPSTGYCPARPQLRHCVWTWLLTSHGCSTSQAPRSRETLAGGLWSGRPQAANRPAPRAVSTPGGCGHQGGHLPPIPPGQSFLLCPRETRPGRAGQAGATGVGPTLQASRPGPCPGGGGRPLQKGAESSRAWNPGRGARQPRGAREVPPTSPALPRGCVLAAEPSRPHPGCLSGDPASSSRCSSGLGPI